MDEFEINFYDDLYDYLETRDACYDDGYQAFYDGTPFDCCFYSGECRKAWGEGWLAAEEDEREMLSEEEDDDSHYLRAA